ncbi:phosphate ABC transporter substrate-binding protein PstS [Cyanobium sp. BA20m-p-22]|uniref:phosphate ABC transporter substrate-binding protein PstS n=1 Tax=Cyanobium sp. BA20m-p-22 TaxID=2823704 RepID=UPI0020CC05B1|nr:phosphate ABC transporter substrate-binding protein PstS [Cyanobium sp. BA20m-p-22]MCP9911472.1 phosphate ABC transporter substrate-binding protein PstS [Cyanobium sp. BA20m-p-22]
MTFLRKSFSALLLAGLVGGTAAQAAVRLAGAGATFPDAIYQRWFSMLAKSGIKVNYQAIGSGGGRKAFINETVAFGASDDPISQKDIKSVKRGVVQIPTVGGTIAVAYNKPGCSLKLTQKQVVSIFMGSIKNWKQLGCADGSITVVHRSDGSGTTAAFTESLQSFSKEWTIGSGKSVNWKVGVGGKGNDGVAGTLTTTQGSIGYLNQAFVKGVLKAAAIQNKAGQFVQPNATSGAKALAGIKLDKNLAGGDPNPSASGAYPIATLTYILFYANGNGSKAEGIRQMITLMLSDKYQALADDLGYVPLRESIQAAAQKSVTRIKE